MSPSHPTLPSPPPEVLVKKCRLLRPKVLSPERLASLGLEPQVRTRVGTSDATDNEALCRCCGAAHLPSSGHNREAIDEQ